MKKITAQTKGFAHFSSFLFPTLIILFSLLLFEAKAQTDTPHIQKGRASFYAKKFHGRRTSNGERYHNKKMTAAHRTLPFGTLVRVTNPRNNKSVIVRINDRGPFIRGRMIDVSQVAAAELGIIAAGTAPVEIEVVGKDADSPEIDIETLAQVTKPIPAKKLSSATVASKPAPRSLPEPILTNPQVYEPGKVYTVKGVAATTRGFGVQVGAFQQLENAVGMCKTLNQQAHQVYIMVEKRKDSKTFCVLAGTFKKRKDAQAFVVSLREKGVSNGFVKRYHN